MTSKSKNENPLYQIKIIEVIYIYINKVIMNKEITKETILIDGKVVRDNIFFSFWFSYY